MTQGQENRMITLWAGEQERRVPAGTTYRALFPDREVLLVTENGKLRELQRPVREGAKAQPLTYKDAAGAKAYQRSCILLLLAAVSRLYGDDPDYALTLHFSLGGGLFFTLAKEGLADEAFLQRTLSYMKELTGKALPIIKRNIATDEAVELFRTRGLKDKEQLFRYRRSSRTNVYELDGYVDYYYGYMADNTACLDVYDLVSYRDGFMLLLPPTGEKKEELDARSKEKLFAILRGSKAWGAGLGLKDVGDLNDRIVAQGADSLILVQEAYHEQQIARIAEQIAADPQKRIVMIAGPSSSGKTTFSHRLSTQLAIHGLRPHPIPVDDYFVEREKTPLNEDGSYNFECLEAIDTAQFNEDMLSLLRGKRVELPTFNFKTGKREYKGRTLQLGEGDVMVIEGIHCLNDALSYALPRENKFKIYISALTQLGVDEHNRIPTTDGRLLRRIIRDARTRGTSPEGTIAMWPSVRRGEENYIFPFQGSADVMFNSALIYELAVLKVYAEPLLFQIGSDSPQYAEAKRLLKFLEYFVPVSSENIPRNSLVREFIGGSCFDV